MLKKLQKYSLLFIGVAFVSSSTLAATAFETDYVWVERFQQALKDAPAGNPKQQYELARMYEKGRGTRKDQTQAFQWYERASNQGHVKSQYKLGYLYLLGKGMKKKSCQGPGVFTDRCG